MNRIKYRSSITGEQLTVKVTQSKNAIDRFSPSDRRYTPTAAQAKDNLVMRGHTLTGKRQGAAA